MKIEMGTGLLSFSSHLVFFPFDFEIAGITLDLIIHVYEHTSTRSMQQYKMHIYVNHPVKSSTLSYTG